LPALRRQWNQAKHEVAPWWAEYSKEAFNSGLDALARALTAWSQSRNGAREGRAVGFPRFRRKGRTQAGVRFTTGAIRVEPDRVTWSSYEPLFWQFMAIGQSSRNVGLPAPGGKKKKSGAPTTNSSTCS
jgi:transposase